MTPMTRRGIIAAGLLAALAACSTSPLPSSGVVGETRDVTAQALPMVNALRSRNGLPALSYQPAAAQAAIDQAQSMAKAQKMAHNIHFGDSFFQRMKSGNVPLPASENVATGQQELSTVIDAWAKSKHHMENMMGNYGSLGVAVAYDAKTKRPYWAMIVSR